MIGGLLIDAMVVAAVVAFAWGGIQLGGVATIGRLLESIAAFWIAALVRDPVGDVIQSILGTSKDFSNLLGMMLVGTAVYIATNQIFRWWRARRDARREAAAIDGEFLPDPLENPRVAAVAGGILGFGWVLLFVALLTLMPVDSPVSRAASASFTGTTQIEREGFLRWWSAGFPHYTQPLPKGELGAVVGEKKNLPMRGDERPTQQVGDADVLFKLINELRRNRRVPELAFNPDVAGVARRQALALATERMLSYGAPGGGVLDARVQAALGESSAGFQEKVGVEVVWAHTPGNASKGLLDSSRASALLRSRKWSEIGIGVSDAGWFNGRIYVLLLIAPVDSPDGELIGDVGSAAAAGVDETAGFGGSTEDATSIDPNSAAGDCAEQAATDIDGDGVPDPESVDPTLCDDTAVPADDVATSTDPATG